ncbi:hypothetical protein K523DRAFT_375397 [Schizophyllum commune Tattone D]|nr:hypothetical protein K523DRAFT_375397 [Schizophyllum commune Tattone D]
MSSTTSTLKCPNCGAPTTVPSTPQRDRYPQLHAQIILQHDTHRKAYRKDELQDLSGAELIDLICCDLSWKTPSLAPETLWEKFIRARFVGDSDEAAGATLTMATWAGLLHNISVIYVERERVSEGEWELVSENGELLKAESKERAVQATTGAQRSSRLWTVMRYILFYLLAVLITLLIGFACVAPSRAYCQMVDVSPQQRVPRCEITF